jgi:hypothetical protein
MHKKDTNMQGESLQLNWHAGNRCYTQDNIKTALFNIEHDKSLRIMVALQCS